MDIEDNTAETLTFEIAEINTDALQIIRNAERFFEASLVVLDSQGSVIYGNSNVSDLLEISDKNLLKNPNITDILQHLAERGDFGPGDPAQFANLATDFFNMPSETSEKFVQTYLTMPSGSTLRIQLCRNADGTVTLTAHDISDQRRDKNMLEMALNIGSAGYLIFDIEKKICRVESRYLSGLLTAEELLTLETKGPATLWHSDDF